MAKYDLAATVAAGLLRTSRDRTGLSQTELAERAGVTQQTVSAYETGRREPTLPTLIRLIAASGLELRFHLAPHDGHDSSVERFMGSLPPARRADLEAAASHRVDESRRRRIRGA